MTYHAQASGLTLRVMPCGLSIHSDPRLLEQMIRNLLSNALKYTPRGKVLVGCRRRGGQLRIEIWDTGIGIPASELSAIFEEYHQLDNPARQRSHGLGLGLSIVKSLGDLLGHPVRVRSLPGKGSVFSIEVPRSADRAVTKPDVPGIAAEAVAERTTSRSGSILIIEDDPEIRDHLALYLRDEGFTAATAMDGPAALELAANASGAPDLVLADYNLPGGMNGVEVAQKLREQLRRPIPFIIVTGDISTDALRNIALHDCVQFNKPVKLRELTQAIDKLLAKPIVEPLAVVAAASEAPSVSGAKIFIVDDDDQVRKALQRRAGGQRPICRGLSDCEAFLKAYKPEQVGVPVGRRLSAGNERPRIAGEAARRRPAACRPS